MMQCRWTHLLLLEYFKCSTVTNRLQLTTKPELNACIWTRPIKLVKSNNKDPSNELKNQKEITVESGTLKDGSETEQSGKAQKISQHISPPRWSRRRMLLIHLCLGCEHQWADVINWKLRYLVSVEHESQK